MKSGWSYEKTSSGARRPDRTGHRWSANWVSGRSEGGRRTDRQSGRSGIWPRYPDGLGTWADRIGARKFKLRHYPLVSWSGEHMKALFLGHFAASVAPRILAKVKTPLETSILNDEGAADHLAPLLSEAEI